MSDYGKEILDRLSENSNLKKESNPARKVFLNTVGAWLDEFEENSNRENLFLNEATGKYIDCHGKEYGVYRKIDESDEDYKKRIIYELLGHLTVDYLLNIYNIKLYVYIPNYNTDSNQLTSDNYYMNNKNGFMAEADETTKAILNKKFVLGSVIKWL